MPGGTLAAGTASVLARVEVSPVCASPLASARVYIEAHVSFFNQNQKEKRLHNHHLNPTEGPVPGPRRGSANICSVADPHQEITLVLI